MSELPVYDRSVLTLAGNIPRIGRLDQPDATATVHSRMCGSTITVDLVLRGGAITDYAQEVSACALGQAAAAIVANAVIGSGAEEIVAGRAAVRAMLKGEGAPPEGRFAGFAALESAGDYPARHPAILLVFDAILAAFEQSGGAVRLAETNAAAK